MKTYEYAALHGIETEDDWKNHFARNLASGEGRTSMYSCPNCREILSESREPIALDSGKTVFHHICSEKRKVFKENEKRTDISTNEG